MIINIDAGSRSLLDKADIITSIELPRMTDDEYNKIKYIIESLGGHWREKYKCFQFDAPSEVVRMQFKTLLEQGKIEISDLKEFKIKNQFYPTPQAIAEEMVKRAYITSRTTVLEPSAGQGAILSLIRQTTNKYTAVEYNYHNVKILRQYGYRVNHMTFEKYAESNKRKFDRIVMNPPFANELDLRHTMLAYELLAHNGKLVGLIAENSLYYDRPITHKFNKWLRSREYNITSLPHGAFKESGTNVDIVMLEILK